MSPGDDRSLPSRAGFPRVSGDEPAMKERIVRFMMFSPRERG